MNEESWFDGGALLETRDFRYDQAGRMTSVNSNELILTFDYDDLDRRTRVIHDYLSLTAMPYLTTLSEFDLNDRRTQVSTLLTMTADSVTNYSYDALDRMTGIQQTGVTGGNAVADKRIEFAYNAANQFSTISRYEDLTATSLVAASDYTFDHAGRLTGLTHSQPGNVLADYGWTFDTGGRLTQSTSLTGGIVDYTHDDTHQLTAATYTTTAGQTTPPANESYTFDANGNRDDASTSIGTDNRLLSDGTYQYQCDAEGNRTQNAHIASGEETTYAWDFHNNLIEVTEKNAAGVTLKTVRYGYDGLDHKIWKEVTDALGTRTEVYAYDGLRGENGRAGDSMILRFDGSGEITNRYLHGPAVDQILADEQVTSASTAGNVLWPLTDHLATVRDVAEHDTVTGITTIANHIVYDSFGNRISETNAAVDTLFGYTGREWDSDIDLQHNRARWYDPATGNWISKDPIGFAAGDANLYRYVRNEATMRVDPSGLFDIFLGVEGELVAIVGVAVSAGVVVDWDTPMESGIYFGTGPAYGISGGAAFTTGFMSTDIEGEATSLDINAEIGGISGMMDPSSSGHGGALPYGPGLGVCVSKETTVTATVQDAVGYIKTIWPF